jgi:hypothetical protein
MNQQEQAEKDGASARSLGRDLLSNPYYAAKGMPSITGEKLEEWHAKAVAWEVGWRAEDSSRAGADTPQPLAGEAIAQQGLLMTLERARAIVRDVENHKYLKLRNGHAALEGSYTAEQLEAIALVLRLGRDS